MSKYQALWDVVKKSGTSEVKLSFEEIRNLAGVEIDHSFLNYKKPNYS